MKPGRTIYRFVTEADRPQVDALWDATDIPKFPTSYPEIVAERDGEIIGFLATHHTQEYVLVEPMLMRSPNIVLYLRLWEALEQVMYRSGVETYYFRVEPHRVHYEKLLWGGEARGIIKHIGYKDGYNWFQRETKGRKLCESLPVS